MGSSVLQVAIGAEAWPVAERYRLERSEPDAVGRSDLRIVVDGDPVRSWVPSDESNLFEIIEPLADTDDAGIASWVEQRGLLGVNRRSLLDGESIREIRDATHHLLDCRRLFEAVRAGSPPNRLLNLALKVRLQSTGIPALVRAEHIAVSSGLALNQLDEPDRKGVSAELMALEALGAGLLQRMRDVAWIAPRVRSTQRSVQLELSLIGTGPLGAAYVQLSQAVTSLVLNRKLNSIERVVWRSPRPCEKCRTEFFPQRVEQRWCSARCRSAGNKSKQRKVGR